MGGPPDGQSRGVKAPGCETVCGCVTGAGSKARKHPDSVCLQSPREGTGKPFLSWDYLCTFLLAGLGAALEPGTSLLPEQ